MPNKTQQDATYTPKGLATYLGVGKAAVYKGLKDGTIPSFRMGKKFIIPRSAIQQWLEKAGNK